MLIDDIPDKNALDIKGNNKAATKGWVDPTISGVEVPIDVAFVDWTTVVVWLENLGGKIHPVIISDVGVAETPNPYTCEAPSITTHQRGRLSAKSNLRAKFSKQMEC